MKTVLVMLMLVMPAIFYAQDKKEAPTSKADDFSAQAGTLIEQQFVNVGTVKDLKIQVMIVKDLMSEKTVKALRIEAVVKTSYGSDTKIASLDADEIDGLIKSMKMLQTVFLSTRDVYTEIKFKSRTGFVAGAYYDEEAKKWGTFLKLEKYDSKSSVYLNTEDFGKLLPLFEAAKEKM